MQYFTVDVWVWALQSVFSGTCRREPPENLKLAACGMQVNPGTPPVFYIVLGKIIWAMPKMYYVMGKH